MTLEDAGFILRLLNEPSFIDNIADKGVRTREDARSYIRSGPMASYLTFGFGLWVVEIKETGDPIGICGLLKREVLDDVDLGYALVPEYWSKGYAMEAASAAIDYAREVLGLKRLAAVVNPDNRSSISLLHKMGFSFERMVKLPGDTKEIKLFVKDIDCFSDGTS